MKKVLIAALMMPLTTLAQTYPSPTFNNITVNGTATLTNATFTNSPSFPGGISISNLSSIAANTVLANATAAAAGVTAFAMPSCSSASSALQWTSGTGFTCASGFAPIANPTFTGTVTIPTGASIAGYLTTASAASTYAPLASPTFTGTPSAPTATTGTNTTQLATTAFVNSSISAISTSTFGTLYASWFNSLPTTLPATSGVFWNNGGVLSKS
ncbi:hypothetical protein [Burkholderia multivorans]|uniref:hypothetical protein n=1 Tax=Burkholderia multivorans TaxID=87883 RepID=UPI00286D614E|nr:hypothetical protein [Burkholderia multivorans]